MKRIALAIAFLAMTMSANALTEDQLREYVKNDALAVSDRDAGKIKWSDYYLISYYQVESTNSPRKSIFLERYLKLTELALAFEAGRISKDEYEVGKLRASTELARQNEALNREAAKADEERTREKMRSLLSRPLYTPTPVTLPPLQNTNQTRCSSRPNGVGGFETTCY